MKKLLFFFFTLLIFAACNNSSTGSKTEPATQDLEMEQPPPPKLPGITEQNKATEQSKAEDVTSSDTIGSFSQFILQGNTPKQDDWDKKIIKTAYLKLEVKNFKAYIDVVRKAAKQYGGYIANEEQNQSEEKIESTITIKVPVEQFESIINQLPGTAEKIVEKKVISEDVSGQVIDTKSRLATKQQMRLKYLEFLKQAKNMEEVLQVQSEINDLQEEIESASGRINYLSHQSAFSTINLTFYQPLAGFPTDGNPGFVKRIIAAFRSGFNFMAELVIGIISIWPVLIFIMMGWVFWKKRTPGLTSSRQNL